MKIMHKEINSILLLTVYTIFFFGFPFHIIDNYIYLGYKRGGESTHKIFYVHVLNFVYIQFDSRSNTCIIVKITKVLKVLNLFCSLSINIKYVFPQLSK